MTGDGEIRKEIEEKIKQEGVEKREETHVRRKERKGDRKKTGRSRKRGAREVMKGREKGEIEREENIGGSSLRSITNQKASQCGQMRREV